MSARTAFVALAIVTVAWPRPAAAQFGRLKKAATDAATQAARGATGSAPAPATTPAAAADLAITDETIAAVIAAFEPQRSFYAKNPVSGASPAERQAALARRKAWDACAEGAMADPAGMNKDYDADRYAALLDQAVKLNTEAARAGTANPALARRLADSATVVQMRASQLMFPGLRQCGDPPSVPEEARADGAPRATVVVTEAAQGKYTRRQLGLLRERIAFWVLTGGKPGAEPPGRYTTYAADEAAALERHRTELAALKPWFGDPRVDWPRWTELPQW